MKNRTMVDPKKMIALEQELVELREEYGIEEEKWWYKVGDFIASKTLNGPIVVNQKKYIRIAAYCGWFCGAHHFYAKRKVLGMLYILFFWTAIPFAMTLIDLMIAIPKTADEVGNITL